MKWWHDETYKAVFSPLVAIPCETWRAMPATVRTKPDQRHLYPIRNCHYARETRLWYQEFSPLFHRRMPVFFNTMPLLFIR